MVDTYCAKQLFCLLRFKMGGNGRLHGPTERNHSIQTGFSQGKKVRRTLGVVAGAHSRL